MDKFRLYARTPATSAALVAEAAARACRERLTAPDRAGAISPVLRLARVVDRMRDRRSSGWR